jgi:hypothetical protein
MNVILTQPVEIALRTLGDEDRQKVLAWFNHLKNWENDAFVRRQAQRLNASENEYVLKATSDLRIFFQLERDQIVVLDITTKSTLQLFGHEGEHRQS